MNFTCITDIPAFFRCISACTGDVSYIDQNGVARDIKQLARQAETLGALFAHSELRDLEIHAVTLEDRRRLLRYMLDSRPAN